MSSITNAPRSALILALAASATLAFAGITADEAARLGRDLTPVGAERAANKDGTIPAWDGGLKGTAPVDAAKGYPDPYLSDKPL